jgi:predicted nucleotidyltransferase
MNEKNQVKLCGLILKKIPDTKLIYLFGSHASNTAAERSDIDIAVLTNSKLASVSRWHIAADLATEMDIQIDLVDLLSASTVMQNEIIQSGLCIFDPNKIADQFAMQIMSMYQHLNEERKEILEQFLSEK